MYCSNKFSFQNVFKPVGREDEAKKKTERGIFLEGEQSRREEADAANEAAAGTKRSHPNESDRSFLAFNDCAKDKRNPMWTETQQQTSLPAVTFPEARRYNKQLLPPHLMNYHHENI